MDNESQTIAIAEIRKDIAYLIELSENWNKKADQMRESYNGRFAMEHADIKGLCERAINMELKIKEFEPTHSFVKDLQGKIFTGFVALLAILGSLIYAVIKVTEKK